MKSVTLEKRKKKKKKKIFLQSLKSAAVLKDPKAQSASLDFPLQLEKHMNKQSQNSTLSFYRFQRYFTALLMQGKYLPQC